MIQVTPVILCGGSGTRLWPLSRKSLPKQFVPLIGHTSLLRLTAARLTFAIITLVCAAKDSSALLVSARASLRVWSCRWRRHFPEFEYSGKAPFHFTCPVGIKPKMGTWFNDFPR